LILPAPEEASERTEAELRALAVTNFLYGTEVLKRPIRRASGGAYNG
jgi:hypothetical protein